MKKIFDFIKPNILIILGGLMFLTYLNYLMIQSAYLALGILGVTTGAFYITVGILNILIPNKLNEKLNKIFVIIGVSLFGVFMFTGYLLSLINTIQSLVDENEYNDLSMGPTGWTLNITLLLVSLAFVTFFILSKLLKNNLFNRFAFLFGGIFALGMLVDLLFDANGFASVGIGEISVVIILIDALYIFYAFVQLFVFR